MASQIKKSMFEMLHRVDKFFSNLKNVYPFYFIKNFEIYEDLDQISNDFIWFIFAPYHLETR